MLIHPEILSLAERCSEWRPSGVDSPRSAGRSRQWSLSSRLVCFNHGLFELLDDCGWGDGGV